jgi:hypothetical protein
MQINMLDLISLIISEYLALDLPRVARDLSANYFQFD